jgi:hypothetical protein
MCTKKSLSASMIVYPSDEDKISKSFEHSIHQKAALVSAVEEEDNKK